MRKLEEIKKYLENDGICASDLMKLGTDRGIIFNNIRVMISDKTLDDFDKWYANDEAEDEVKCPCKDCEGCDIPLDEMESHLAGLWITIHDVATEAIENPIDMCLQTKCSVKLNALAKSVLDVFSSYDLCLEVPEDEE